MSFALLASNDLEIIVEKAVPPQTCHALTVNYSNSRNITPQDGNRNNLKWTFDFELSDKWCQAERINKLAPKINFNHLLFLKQNRSSKVLYRNQSQPNLNLEHCFEPQSLKSILLHLPMGKLNHLRPNNKSE